MATVLNSVSVRAAAVLLVVGLFTADCGNDDQQAPSSTAPTSTSPVQPTEKGVLPPEAPPFTSPPPPTDPNRAVTSPSGR
ncbi:Uncharacterised protein [Mycobacteroides abscessus subsp. abscessus]|nr:Uncharacterised protein [Mycobacteroides abscessus subsp. abscessus]